MKTEGVLRLSHRGCEGLREACSQVSRWEKACAAKALRRPRECCEGGPPYESGEDGCGAINKMDSRVTRRTTLATLASRSSPSISIATTLDSKHSQNTRLTLANPRKIDFNGIFIAASSINVACALLGNLIQSWPGLATLTEDRLRLKPAERMDALGGAAPVPCILAGGGRAVQGESLKASDLSLRRVANPRLLGPFPGIGFSKPNRRAIP